MANAVRAACLLALLAAGFPAHAADDVPLPVDLELVIAVDVSGSMDAEEFALQREGYVAAIRHPEFIAAVRSGAYRRIALTYVEWSGADRQTVIVPWTAIDGSEAAEDFAAALASRPIDIGRGTSISAALLFSARLIGASPYDGLRRVIDVSGDGPNNYGPAVTMARDLIVAGGIVVNGLPILIRPSPLYPEIDLYYADCVIGGPGSFVLPVRAEEEFAAAIRRKLVIEVAAGPAEAEIMPASGRGTADCFAGERLRLKYADPYLPGL